MALAVNGRIHGKFLFSKVNYPCLGGYQSPDCSNRPSFKSQRRNYANCDEDNPIKCKVAIVTGGARGIGYHIADKLLAAGAQVIISFVE
ncbi:unnamed protein product [Callosobruchus maculatus]|uniref:Uncharacterized protein n=1 Tax=Callosobruchus maculatus TaxID=64391 RepID=A0A653BHP1_CALMS|nr:unnamed protein product [Callosobruchus maculatus]